MIAKIEAVVGRKVFLSREGVDQKMACELCVALLNQIQTLEQQLLSCKTDLASKYASANSAPTKQSRFDLELFIHITPCQNISCSGVPGNRDQPPPAVLVTALGACLPYLFVSLPRITLTPRMLRCLYNSLLTKEILRVEEIQDWMYLLRRQNWMGVI